MSQPRIVIIGAGPCGLGAAHRLAEQGYSNYVLYEKNPYVGGLAASFLDAKGFTWDFGVHVAHSHYHYVDHLMESLLPDGFYTHERRSWVRVCHSWVPYPFQYNFRHLPEGPRRECLDGLESLTGDPHMHDNFGSWICGTFGRGIAKYFMLPYNRKIWATDPDLMGIQWMGDRVPRIDVARVRRNIAESKDDVSWGPNHVFQYPRRGGTGAVWNRMAEKLPRGVLRLNEDVVQIDPVRKRIVLAGGGDDHYDRLISSIPIPELVQRTGMGALAQDAAALQYTHVYVAGVAVNKTVPEVLNDKTWIYCPEEKAAFYRVTPYSIFSPAHVPDASQWCSMLCEISAAGHSPMVPPDQFNESAVQGLNELGLISSSAGNTHYYPMSAEYGYPVPTLDRDRRLNAIIPALETHDIFSRGRFGGWKYEVGNMDHSVMQGVEVVDRLLFGTPEETWPEPSRVNTGGHQTCRAGAI